MITITGKIVRPDGVRRETVVVENGRIVGPVDSSGKAAKEHDFGDCLVVPGFIDVHMHGIGEHCIFTVSELEYAAKMLLKFGTTGFLSCPSSVSEQRYLESAANVRGARELVGDKGARILGAHFEGPFINPERKGGMDPSTLRAMDVELCQRYIDGAKGVLKLMTLSPELAGSDEIIELLRENGVVVSLGHSAATKEQLRRAIDKGLSHVCHLFNTFEKTGVAEGWQWKPGLIEAILNSDEVTCELICDMQHVLPEYVKLAAKILAPDRFVAITDSLPGAGLGPGTYTMLDGREFSNESGMARLTSNNGVVGSVLTMNRAFANLVEVCGIDPVMAARFTSGNAARVLGLDNDYGSVSEGKCADLAVLDGEYNCVATFLSGELVYEN